MRTEPARRHAVSRRPAALLPLLLLAASSSAVAAAADPTPAREPASAADAAPGAPRPEGPPGAVPEGVDAPIQLVVNGVAREIVVVRLLPDGEVALPVAALEAAGLRGLGGDRGSRDGAEWVRLRSLAPRVSFELDETSLELRVSARAELLGRTALDVRAAPRPEGMQTGGHPSAFANYAVQGDDRRQVAAFAELGGGSDGWLASTAVSRTTSGEVVRGLSSVTLEQREALRRWTAGDVVANGGPLGGTVVLGGAGVEREFGLDPWFVRQPLPRATAVALTPSTLEVYVNGRLARREVVAPGTIDLANVPVEAGAGQVRTVLRDAYGRTQDVTAGYYFSAGLLAPGVSDYAFHAGLRRSGIGSRSLSYSDAVGVGRWRAGLTEALTLGGRLEAGRELASGGPHLTAAMPLGDLEASIAGSTDGQSPGGAALLGWTYASRRASGGARLQAMTRAYVNASLDARADRALLQASAFGAIPVGRGLTMGLEGSASRMRDGFDLATMALRGTASLGAGASLLATVGWAADAAGRSGPTATLLLTRTFGGPHSASMQAERSPGAGARGGAGLQRALGSGPGVGYRVESSGGDGGVSVATVQAQGDHGRVEASYQRANGVSSSYATGSGGLVYMDGELFLTRAVQDGYALVQVPGVEGVRATLNSTEVGRTNARGNLLVPGVLPYQANRIAIRPSDVPIEYELEAVERLVAPPRRVGARVRFAATRAQGVTGTLSVREAQGEVTPAYGELRVEGAKEPSPLASDGRFYLSAVPAGRHDAEVEYGGGSCRFALDVPPSAAAVVDLGAVRCVAAETAAAAPPAGEPSASTVTQRTVASVEGGNAMEGGNATRTGAGEP